ncbi:LacI family DNA-binding transcriptional regulator [Rhodospirillaceae bacterium SYSU D60014]|uniref:LacI family DNA-binding transcriptional regulator n=1 Tax=Virgifigura deserti TaxID=2268457 RepID=UPI000E664BBB
MPRTKTKRPTIADIAGTSGVSLATVDRVLNHRGGVREVTLKRVLEAAAEHGYLPKEALARALHPSPMKLVFLLPSGTNRYLRLLGERIRSSDDRQSAFNLRIKSYFIEGFDPFGLAEALKRHGRNADGIAFMALAHPAVREAVATLAADGKHVVTFVSDLPNSERAAYVGLDNRACGRTAAYLLGRFTRRNSGKIALIAGSLHYRAHQDREMGFMSLLHEQFPEMELIGLREGHDDRSENYHHAKVLLADHPDLIGIYNIGGSSDGIARALREAGRAQGVVFVGHGLTEDTRAMLIDGTMDIVITQSPDIIVHNTLQIFSNLRAAMPILAGVPPINLEIISCENIP